MKIYKYLTFTLALFLTSNALAQNSYIFWSDADSNDTSIYRTTLDGSDTQLVTNTASASSLATDQKNQKIYWFDSIGSTIERANFDGSQRETVVSSGAINYVVRFDTVHQKLIYLTIDNLTYKLSIVKANPDGSSPEAIFESEPYDYIREIELDPIENVLYAIIERGDRRSGTPYFYAISLTDGSVITNNILPDGNNYSNINLNAERTGMYFGYGYELSVIDIASITPQSLFQVNDGVNRFVFDPVTNQFIYGIYRSGVGTAISKSDENGGNYSDVLSPANFPVTNTDAMAIFNLDTDGDGTADALDSCPSDETSTAPGVCGCGVAVEDLNNNDIPDCFYNQEVLSLINKVSKRLNRFYVKPRAEDLHDYISANVNNIAVNENANILKMSKDILRMAKKIVTLKRRSPERAALKAKIKRALKRLTTAVTVIV
jgi:hypothetical protein